jgi:hypothetical protein
LSIFDIDPADAFANQHVLFDTFGGDTLLRFDSDGPVTLATVSNATLTQSDFIVALVDPL